MSAKFSKRLVELMERLNWTQSRLARELGSERQRVGHWVKGRSEPDSETIRRIAAAMGVPVSELVDDSRPGGLDGRIGRLSSIFAQILYQSIYSICANSLNIRI